MHKQLQSLCTLNTKFLNKTATMKSVWTNASSCSQNIKPTYCDLNIRHDCVHHKTENCLELSPKITNIYPCRNKIVISDKHYQTSILTGKGDHRSAENLQKLFEADKCKLFWEAEKQHPALFVKTDPATKNINITGLSCRSNKSLSMLAMDSLLYANFALRLGIDLSNEPDRTAVVILNDKMESHYILKQPITSDSVKEFISNFSMNHLNRSFSSLATLLPPLQLKKTNESQIVVKELNTNTFLPTVLQQDNAVVVFYYTKQCSFCNGISYIFLTVAKKLASMRNLVFARIDGDVNILPWEYTMDTYPTILFFPYKRKSESRVFPSGISITVSNIISFLLVNLEPNLKLQALWYLCIQTKQDKEQSSCYSTLLGETLNLIDTTLKEWRKSHTLKRQNLLHRLKSLRQLHLLFAHAKEKQGAILGYFKNIDSSLRQTDFNLPIISKPILEEL